MPSNKVMYLEFNNPKADYMMDGITLDTVTEEKALGVITDEELK